MNMQDRMQNLASPELPVLAAPVAGRILHAVLHGLRPE